VVGEGCREEATEGAAVGVPVWVVAFAASGWVLALVEAGWAVRSALEPAPVAEAGLVQAAQAVATSALDAAPV